MTIKEDIERALAVLRGGGVILYPTDTVWGIGCDATSSEAVRKVFEIKHRPESKALISLVGSEEMLERAIGREVPESVADFIRKAPRPVTVVYDDVKGRESGSQARSIRRSCALRLDDLSFPPPPI